jgi:hypothetical protein
VVKLKSGAGYFSKASYSIKVRKEGYNEVVIPVEFKLNGWYFGNLLFGGFPGLLVADPLTGAMWRLKWCVSSRKPAVRLSVSFTST